LTGFRKFKDALIIQEVDIVFPIGINVARVFKEEIRIVICNLKNFLKGNMFFYLRFFASRPGVKYGT
jgi:hypothetical protein